MGLLNENQVKMQLMAGVISENRFDELMKQIKSEKEASDQYEEDKEELYGLNENEIDPIARAKTDAAESYNWLEDAIEYVGGKKEWEALSVSDKEEVKSFMKNGQRSDLNESVNPEVMKNLVTHLSTEKNAADEYEREKEEIYGLHEGVDISAMNKLMSQIKNEKEAFDEYEKERDDMYLQEGHVFKSTILRESVEEQVVEGDKFSDFLRTEYGDTPAPQEVAEAIVNWANNYMTSDQDADFEGVSEYMNDDIWALMKDDVSENYMSELRAFVSQQQNGVDEQIGIKPKDDIDTEMGGIEPSLKEDEVNESQGDQILKKKLDNVFAAAIQSLPGMLKKADKDRDGKLELTGEPQLNEQYLNEVLGLGLVAANLALSAPGIVGLAGKLIKGMGSIPGMNINALKTAGDAVSKFGKDWQAKHMKAIEVILRKFMPNADEKTIERGSKAVFIVIMASLAISGGVVAGTGSEAEAVNSAVGVGKTAGGINKTKDLGLQLAKADTSDWKSKLSGLLPFAIGKVFG